MKELNTITLQKKLFYFTPQDIIKGMYNKIEKITVKRVCNALSTALILLLLKLINLEPPAALLGLVVFTTVLALFVIFLLHPKLDNW